jgi:hypothetical protein
MGQKNYGFKLRCETGEKEFMNRVVVKANSEEEARVIAMNSIPFGWIATSTGETTENTGLSKELIN